MLPALRFVFCFISSKKQTNVFRSYFPVLKGTRVYSRTQASSLTVQMKTDCYECISKDEEKVLATQSSFLPIWTRSCTFCVFEPQWISPASFDYCMCLLVKYKHYDQFFPLVEGNKGPEAIPCDSTYQFSRDQFTTKQGGAAVERVMMSVGFLPSVVDLNIIQGSVNHFRSALCCLTSVKQWNLFQIMMVACCTVCLQQFFTFIGSLKYRIGKRGNFLFLPRKAEQCNKFVLVFMLHVAIRNNGMKFSRGCRSTSPK